MDYNVIYKSLNSRWRELARQYLPLSAKDSIWRFSRDRDQNDPDQGWKLHVSATIHSASETLAAVGPFLHGKGAMFKAPVSLYELQKLNSGSLYGYSQVGKFITVYPRNFDEAVSFARELHRLTSELPGPVVPFDHRYRSHGCVYYRYGAFTVIEKENSGEKRSYWMRDPEGNLVPDDRESTDIPVWISNPFEKSDNDSRASCGAEVTLLQTTFKAYEAVAQRGRGGVFKAIDLSSDRPRLCILKEGRRHGEVDWDGRDGAWRVLHEGQVLQALNRGGLSVPGFYSSFQVEEDSYIVIELIDGVSLNDLLRRRRRRLSIRQVLRYAIGIASLVAEIHQAGWVWRDCKPGNIMITRGRKMVAIDFEGACPIDQPDPAPWGTRRFVPPEWDHAFSGQLRLPEDLYAMGAIMHLLLTGAPPEESSDRPERKVPKDLQEVVNALLSVDPERRPAADVVARRLKRILNSLDAGSDSDKAWLAIASGERGQHNANRFEGLRIAGQ
jgi:class IV lanthipeptide synthase